MEHIKLKKKKMEISTAGRNYKILYGNFSYLRKRKNSKNLKY